MNPRIGLIVYGENRVLSGINRYTDELQQALKNNCFNPLIFHPGSNSWDQDGISLPGTTLLPSLLTLGQLEIAWAARERDLQLIHDPTGTMPHTLARSRSVTTIHDVIPYTHPGSSTTLDWLIYHYWSPLAVRRVNAVITDSVQSKGDIIRYLPVKSEKVTVVPLAANKIFRVLESEEIQPTLSCYAIDSPYILYVGSAAPRKNVSRIVEAFSQLRSWSDSWILVIAGGGKWDPTPVSKAVKELGLSNCVHFPGFIDDKDLPALYNGADLFVFPSLYEGFGLPVLEAMACGTPVVTSNTTSLPEVAGDAALQVDPTNIEEIAGAMRRVLEDPELAADLRARGLKRASQFTWERTARETIKVYEKVLGQKILDDD